MAANLELFIAAGLLLTVLVVYLASRAGMPPTKSLPIAGAAVFGALGWIAFAIWRRKATDARINELKERIAERDKRLADVMARRQIADKEVAAAQIALDDQKAVVEVEQLRIHKQLDAKLAEIEKQSSGQAVTALDRVLREELEYQRRTGQRAP